MYAGAGNTANFPDDRYMEMHLDSSEL
jgi:hypothetical protein